MGDVLQFLHAYGDYAFSIVNLWCFLYHVLYIIFIAYSDPPPCQSSLQKEAAMDSDFQTGSSPHPGKKKRRRDRNSVGDPNLANRGKPISEKWKPVWIWLQSLERKEVVESGEILAWLDNNPGYASEIRKQHTPGVLVAYVQKCHQRLISGRYTKIEDSKVLLLNP